MNSRVHPNVQLSLPTPIRRPLQAPLLVSLALLGTTLAYALSDRAELSWAIGGYAVMTIGSALIVGWRLRGSQRFGLLVLLVAQVYWFSLPAFRKALLGLSYSLPLPDTALVAAIPYLLLFYFASIAAYFFMARHLAKAQPAAPASEAPSRQAQPLQSGTGGRPLLLLLLFVIGISPMVVYSDARTDIVNAMLLSRSSDKPWHRQAFESKPIAVVGRASMVTCGMLCLLFALRERRRNRRLAFGSAFLLVFFITYVDSGTRTWTGLIAVPPLLIFLRQKMLGRRYALWLITAVFAAFAFYSLVQMQLVFRDSGFAGFMSSAKTIDLERQNDFFAETAMAIDLVPRRMDYLRESTTILFLTNPIPRVFWPEKPYPRVIEQYTIGRSGENEYRRTGVSRMPSIVGQFYMSWGWPGVLLIALELGLLLGWLDFKWTSKNLSPIAELLLAATFVLVFFSFRGVFPGFHYPLVLLGILLFLQQRRFAFLPHFTGAQHTVWGGSTGARANPSSRGCVAPTMPAR